MVAPNESSSASSVSPLSAISSCEENTNLAKQQPQQELSQQQQPSSLLSSPDDSLDAQLAQARAELAALREAGHRQRMQQAQQRQALENQRQALQQQRAKLANRLHLFLYTHAMLQAQTSVVQPYIVKKQALLCHAFHHTEVLTKQVQLMKGQSDQLVAVLEHSKEQIDAFWQSRLSPLRTNITQTRNEIHDLQGRLMWNAKSNSAAISTRQELPFFSSNLCIIEEEMDERDDEDDDLLSTTSASTMSSYGSSIRVSHPPTEHHQHDVVYQVLSMALTAVSEGRLPDIFDHKKSSEASSLKIVPLTYSQSSNSCPASPTKEDCSKTMSMWGHTSQSLTSLVGM